MAIKIGEAVYCVKDKLGLATEDYTRVWTAVNVGNYREVYPWHVSSDVTQKKAYEICTKRYGSKPVREITTLGAIIELKDFFPSVSFGAAGAF